MLRLLTLLSIWLIVAPASQAQLAPSYAGVTVTRAPLDAANAGTSVQLTSDADLSPFPSFIDYPSESVASTWLVGAAVGYRPAATGGLTWAAGLETSLLYSAVADGGPAIDITTGEIGAGYLLRLGSGLGVEVGVAGLVGLATGTVGVVGSRQGDVFLISPDDGERYETQSEITATGLGFGLNAMASVVAGPVSAGIGYRLATPIETWEYAVRDADMPERTSRLPSAGFASNPPSYKLGGLHIRVGLNLPLGASPSRAQTPPPAFSPPPPQIRERPAPQPDPPPVAVAPPPSDPLLGVPAPGRDRNRWVQARLNDRGFGCGDVDGRVGPQTRQCIRAFRTANGLSATADIDDDLLILLNADR
ncbi:peptidoglycan-binding domain-containing protein [Rubrivirga sp. IMCC43871]|uniref:peptidoglycan-binding domain-containing protein n=1 Tax=Rubrivirga sp. IMCC43871 TaxID=3391575 RepID=UPI0039902066